MGKEYRFRFFPLRFFTGTFDVKEFEKVLQDAWKGGFRLLRREFSLEPARIMVILQKLAFGVVFQKDPENLEPDTQVKVVDYQTRLLTATIDLKKLNQILNAPASEGYELAFTFKYQARFLMIFPRECYFFVFIKNSNQKVSGAIEIHQHSYRLFTQTIDPDAYEKDLNSFLSDKELRITVRDEKRVFGILPSKTSVVIAQKKS